MNIKNGIIILFLILLTGCCGKHWAVGKIKTVTLAYKYMNTEEKTISLGMTKEQVTQAWGKPDWVGSLEEKSWFYSNVKEVKTSTENERVTHEVFFDEGKVVAILETLLHKEKGCPTFDL